MKNQHKSRSLNFIIRPIEAKDNPSIAAVIRQSFIDNKVDHLEGVSLNDPCLEHLSEVYQDSGSGYWVVEVDGVVKGGVGIAPVLGGDAHYCELQKMYVDQSVLGHGLGSRLLSLALEKAQTYGYQYCYLESLEELKVALKLYEKFGFQRLQERIGNTGHDSCSVCMLKDLRVSD